MTDSERQYIDLAADLLSPDLGRALALVEWAGQNGFVGLGARYTPTGGAEDEGPTRRLEQLEQGARALGCDLSLFLSPVVRLDKLSGKVPPWLRQVALGPHSLLLVELPEISDLKAIARATRQLVFEGFTTVALAPERNPEVRRIPELLRYLLQVGVISCADAGCFVGLEGNGRAQAARRVWGLGYYGFFTGFVRGEDPPVQPALVREHLTAVPSSWRSPQGRTADITSRAVRLLGGLSAS